MIGSKMEGDLSTDQLAKILHEAGNSIDEFVAPVIKNTAGKIADTQRAHVAKRSRKTEKSIKVTGPNGSPLGKKTVEAEIGPTFFVGKLLELGTSNMAPRPFVEGSSEPHMAQHVKDVETAAVKALKGLT